MEIDMGKKIALILKKVFVFLGVSFASFCVLFVLCVMTGILSTNGTLSNIATLLIFALPVVFGVIGAQKLCAPKGNPVQWKIKSESVPVAEGRVPTAYEIQEGRRILAERKKRQLEEAETFRVAQPVQPTTFATISSATTHNAGGKEKSYRVAGVTYYEDNIMRLAIENPEYEYSKKEFVDNDLVGERVYKYDFDPCKVELQPEPDNPKDPNAIKVIVDGEHIGYIIEGSCSHLLKVISRGGISCIKCEMGGGPYKYVSEDYDDEKDEEVYNLEKNNSLLYAHLKITEKEG